MLSMQIPFMVLNVMVGLSFQQEYSEVSFSNSSGIARASGSFGSFSPSQAFERAVYIPENRDNRFWHSAFNRPAPSTFPQSLWYEFPEKIRVVKYSFRSRRWGDWLISADGPSKYVFWASNSEDCSDETQRKELHKDNSGTQFDLQNTPKVMTITNHKFYRCYGFKVTDVPGRDRMTPWNNVGDKYVTISDVRFYEITGCVYGLKSYTDGSTIGDASPTDTPDLCLGFKCVNGNWIYSGRGVNLGCGNCTLFGDPHIFTYEPHYLIGGPLNPDLYESPKRFDAEYAVSQQGKSYDSSFGVYANFTECLAATCVERVHYAELGIKVELILPKQLWESTGPWPWCKGAPPRDPLCATKIFVNKEELVIADGSVTPVSGTVGTVLIIKSGKCTSAYCQIYVVGSKGITVSLLIEPKLYEDGNPNLPEMYQLNVYPTPSLHNQLFGLCDTFSGTSTTDTTSYTPRNGLDITNFDNLDKFVESWNTKK